MHQEKIDAANMALLKNDFASAIKYYLEALAIKKHFGTYLNLSVAYKKMGNIDESLKCL
jgi:tetratricopeptide (TPR) repeat protein